ncbi:MAG TPA: S9 family peptidase [Steroidobacteraceae bacterium]|nr:S9 family peptidase [Steroidobacteraceae bacterium]
MKASICLLWLLGVVSLPMHAAEVPASAPVSLDDLFSGSGARDVAVSPNGHYLAAIVSRPDDDVLVVQDLTSGARINNTRIGHGDVGSQYDARMITVYWKTDDRVLFRVSISPAKGASWSRLANGGFRRLGNRLFAVDRDGGNLVRLLADNRNRELNFAFDLGDIRSMLPRDPDNILMTIDGMEGRSLFKVNVRTGAGEVMERASAAVWDWWLDLDGRPVVRVDVSSGRLRFYRRETGERWKKFYQVRLGELKQQSDYAPLGPSDQPGKFYVLARPDGAQRRGVYLYDLEKESFGAPLAENPQFDITSAFVSREGRGVQVYCYLAHVRICESADAKVNAHMKGVRKYFKDSANVYVVDASDDNQILLMYVEGPSDPPAYYEYSMQARQINLVGHVQQALADKLMPTASLIEYVASDGMKLNGYLTLPSGAENARQLPLVVMPHGGPEMRDHLTFDVYVQFLAARGYAVFQPNFRGSDGFGRTFAESGYGEWGRRMQDDIGDGLKLLVDRRIADPQRVCIVGASYGGYAALAGATLTPELYRCVVSIAGISDLADFLKSRRQRFGSDSELYQYWMKLIGDPERDAERIAAVSPTLHIDRIKAPILLAHGDADTIVPYGQSMKLKKLLDKSGRKTRLITLEDEGHSGWSPENERLVLEAVGQFLLANIGAGFDPRTAQTH